MAYVAMGDADLAFAWLQKACLEHSSTLTAPSPNPQDEN